MASWEDEDPLQDSVEHPGQAGTLDLTEDDLALSEVAFFDAALQTCLSLC